MVRSDMSNQQKMLGLAGFAFVLFLMGLWIALPKAIDHSPTPDVGVVAPGKLDPEEARRTPTPDPRLAPDPRPTQAAVPVTGTGTVRGSSLAWVIQDGTKVYSEPQLGAQVVASLRYGDEVRPMERQENWQKVLLAKQGTGWIPSQFLTLERPADLGGKGPEDAIKVVTRFYECLNEHQYSAAYDLLSFDWKRELDYTRFAQGYASTQAVSCTILKADLPASDRVRVFVELIVTEPKRRVQIRGSYVVRSEGSDWRRDQGDLREIRSEKTDSDDEDEYPDE